jgi:hypothetical protein
MATNSREEHAPLLASHLTAAEIDTLPILHRRAPTLNLKTLQPLRYPRFASIRRRTSRLHNRCPDKLAHPPPLRPVWDRVCCACFANCCCGIAVVASALCACAGCLCGAGTWGRLNRWELVCVGGEYGESEYGFGVAAWEFFCWSGDGSDSCYFDDDEWVCVVRVVLCYGKRSLFRIAHRTYTVVGRTVRTYCHHPGRRFLERDSIRVPPSTPVRGCRQ